VLVACAGCAASLTRADYTAAVGSPPVRSNRMLEDQRAEPLLAKLGERLPWAEWATSRLREVCEPDLATSFGSPNPGTIGCETRYTRLAGFDGDLADRLRALDAAARDFGWLDSADSSPTAIRFYETYRGKPLGDGPLVVDASSVPAVTYVVPQAGPGTSGCVDGDLRVSSVEQSSPWLDSRFAERPVYDPVFERANGPQLEAAARELLGRHRFVTTFTLLGQCHTKVAG